MDIDQKSSNAIQLLAAINRLGLKAYSCKTESALKFLILNDTLQIVRYNQALLWKFQEKNKTPDLIGISGQTKANKQTMKSELWDKAIEKEIKDPNQPKIFNLPHEVRDFEKDIGKPMGNISVLWLPIHLQGKLMLGLWLERWNANWQHDEIEILNFLAQSYAAAWEKFDKPSFFGLTLKHPVITALCASSLLLLFIKIPLPVSAPCEVIASSPVVVTAPLEGIIKDVDVEPGQSVVKDEVLFQYDKRVPLEELNVAMKEVEMVEAEMKKTNALALKDKKALEQLGLLALKLKKEKTELSLAQYKASQLVVKSPLTGIVMFDNPEQWRGNPVKVGEKIMTVSDPRQTKVRLWIPENDNIDIEMGRPIKVVLNVEPDVSYAARLVYIANSSALNEKGLPSFLADAEWEGAQPALKLGLKGNAIIYGKDVTIFYWLIRRPLTYARSVLGF